MFVSFIEIIIRDDKGPVKYGDVVALKAPACRER